MILLKKKDHVEELLDYHPIILIHSFTKLVTKCLANRPALVMDSMVMQNQSAFIKG